jgi:hypothetical protein
MAFKMAKMANTKATHTYGAIPLLSLPLLDTFFEWAIAAATRRNLELCFVKPGSKAKRRRTSTSCGSVVLVLVVVVTLAATPALL